MEFKKILTAAIISLLILSGSIFNFINLANAAEVVIDSAIHATGSSHSGSTPTVVFISDQTGYAFYRDSTGSCVYAKTANGGVSWGTAVIVDSQTDCFKIGVWYDQWTPGDISGSNIHIVTMDAGDLSYAKLNTSNDSLATIINATGANQGGAFANGGNIPSITKSTSGIIYMGVQDAGDSFVIKCSASCDNATNWTEAGTNPFDLAVDELVLMPLSGGNIIAIRRDTSADAVGSKVYSSSGNSWDASWTTIDSAATKNATYDAEFGAAVNKTTNDIYLAYAADITTFGTNDDIRTALYSGGSWTSKTDVLTNDAKGITGAKIALDQNTGDVYVIYSARTTAGTASTGNIYYKKSINAMAGWGSETQVNSTAGDIYGARLNILSDERLYSTWGSATVDDLFGNTVFDLVLADTTVPADISNLTVSGTAATTITLTWTAPGDDGLTGTAASYDLRYSTSAITADNFNSATAVIGEPAPSVAGSLETITVTGLSQSTTYFFALKTSDEVPNTSAISNVPSGTTSASSDTIAPAAVSDLAAASPTASSLAVSWTAPGDDGLTGTATTYDLRYSTTVITDGNFSSATAATGEPSPQAAGTNQSMTVSGLSANTAYYFALKTSDEVPNTSAISNVPSGTTSAAESEPTIIIPSGGGGSNVSPTSVRFSGQAYPGATIEVLRKSPIDAVYKNIPLSEFKIDASGFFIANYTAFLQSEYFFAIRAQDKDGRKSGILTFFVNLVSSNELVKENILLPPTIGSSKLAYSKGENMILFGYAAPNKKVEIEVDGLFKTEVISGNDGKYSISTSTGNFELKDYFAKSRQINSDAVASGYSLPITFRLSLLQFPKADFNADSQVNVIDWSIFLFNWGSKDNILKNKIDINGDGKVDIADFSIFLKAMKI